MAINNISVTAQAIAALKKMREDLEYLNVALTDEVNRLTDAFEQNRQGLGPHEASIRQLLEQLGVETQTAQIPVKKLVLRLDAAAMIRQHQLDNNTYSK